MARRVLTAVEKLRKPCVLLVSKGMHWVVAFGGTRKDDGLPAGLLLRDPAWAGMPRFFGLSVFPETPTMIHTCSDEHRACACLSQDPQPGTVHERYFAMDELLSERGLQGSPDWEDAVRWRWCQWQIHSNPPIFMSDTDPRAAALRQTREHGLWGRADSPPDWQAALDGATPGDPVLVRSPDDRRDDFYLVPMRPGKPAARSAWVILDRDTLKLREASLLDHWPAPAFPDEKDRNRLSQTSLILPDGTRAQFRAEELQPNLKNFVWKPTEAAILPYWPVKEFIAAHPLTREPVSIYLTQDGNILTDLDYENSQLPSTLPKKQGTTDLPRWGSCSSFQRF